MTPITQLTAHPVDQHLLGGRRGGRARLRGGRLPAGPCGEAAGDLRGCDDADAFPVTCEGAMNTCALYLACRVREGTSTQRSPLNNLVEVSKLYGLEESMRKILHRTEPTGASANELERKSLNSRYFGS